MSSKNLEKVIQRAISDAAFRRQLQSNPEAALRGFKLTSDEVTALRSGDAGRLMSLGVDQRMSKAFQIGDPNLMSRASVDGLSMAGGAAVADQGATRLSSAVVGDPQTEGGAAIDPGNVSRGPAAVDPGNVGRGLSGVDMDHRRGEHFAGDISTARSANANVDQVQRAGERIASDASFATNANIDQAQRAGERIGSDATSGVAQHEPGSFGDPVRPVIVGEPEGAASPSSVRDVTDVDLRSGLVAPTEGSPEAWAFQNAADASSATSDNTAAMAAGRAGSMGTGGEAATPSSIRDVAPPDVGSSSTYSGDDLAGPGYLASSDTEAVRAVRDVDDVDLRGSAATTDASDAIRAVRDVDDVDLRGSAATTDASDAIRAVRDVDDVDLRGTAATTNFDAANAYPVADPDSAEAYSPSFHSSGGMSGDAFLSSEEASQYNAAIPDGTGLASDEGQLYSPAADTTAIPEEHHGGDAIGNTAQGDPEITA
jgi:hypothetical protein